MVVVASLSLYLGHKSGTLVGSDGHDVNLARIEAEFREPPRTYLAIAAIFGKLLAEIALEGLAGIGGILRKHEVGEVGVVVKLYHGAVALDKPEPELKEKVGDAESNGAFRARFGQNRPKL